jgi:DNA-damage-inducible protein D
MANLFDDIRRINEYDQEYWYARELQKVLEYRQWRRFSEVIDRAKAACKNSGTDFNHFADVGKMVEIGSAAQCRRTCRHLTKASSRLKS